MLVDEAPSAVEIAQEQPFAAGAGYIMNGLMSKVGLSLDNTFITHVVHEPIDFTKAYKGKDKAAMLQYLKGVMQLKKDIEETKPNVIAALGEAPLRALMGKSDLRSWRGSIVDSTLVPGTKVIATYTPDFVLKMYEYKAVMEFDLRRIVAEAAYPELRLPERTYYLDSSLATGDRPNRDKIVYVTAETRQSIMEEMHFAEWLSVDIECVPDANGRWRISCVGFSDRPDRALVLLANNGTDQAAIQYLLRGPANKVYQNGSFDVTVLLDHGYTPNNFTYDTMLGHHVLYAEAAAGASESSQLEGKKRQAALAKGLAFQASIYTREPYYKADGKVSAENQDWWLHCVYNARDVAVTREILDVQQRELAEAGQQHIMSYKMDVVPATLAAMRRGIKIDVPKREILREELEAEISRLQSIVDTMAGKHINVKSSPQVKEFLYDVLKLPPKINRKTKAVTADKDAINELAYKHNNPGLLSILKIRERRDLIERYVNTKLDADGRIRCSIDITGTRSDRLSSRASIYGSGTNLQNIATRTKIGQKIKELFIADEGKVLIQRDYKQAEAWLVAYEARCEGLIELLNDSSRDIHYENASRIFDKPISDISSEERYLAKRVVHASNYGMGPARLIQLCAQDGVHLTYSQAEMLMAKYFMLYPEIKENFWSEVEREVRRNRTLTNAYGRKRTFFSRMDDKLIREAYSWKPQSTVGLMGVIAFANCYRQVEVGRPELGAEVLMQVHDSVLMQCDEDKIDATAAAMNIAMEQSLIVHGREFIIPSDCQAGKNWAKQHEGNPHGLIDVTT